jgi:hypothetical protein
VVKNRIAGLTVANPLRLAILAVLGGFLLAACAASERHEMTIWYIATDGDDDNVCTESTDPCRTLAEVLGRVDADDKIIMAAGAYNEIEAPAIVASLWITGAGMGETIIDMTGIDGLRVIGWGAYHFENFTIQNSQSNCIAITYRSRSEAAMSGRPGFTVAIENVEATGCGSSGFFASGDHGTGTGDDVVVTLVDVVATSNGFDGVAAVGAEVIIQGGEFSENIAGGIYSSGGAAVSAVDSLISANLRGAIVVDDSSLLLEVSTINDSPSEGVYVAGDLALVQMNNVTISNNYTDATGVGQPRTIHNIGGTIAIRNSWITRNLGGAILNNGGEISIDQTTIDENTGSIGTIQNEAGAMVIQNSLIANNIAVFAIRNDAELSIQNSTISGNSETGVIVERDELSLSYVTIAENGDAGLTVQGDGGIDQITNVLIVKNGLDCVGTRAVLVLRIGGTNFDSDGSCPEPFITRSSAEILLDTLADNGGLTFTHALLPGSPAIDAASSSCPSGDQRLVSRPVGPACDVGAYEAGAVATLLEVTPTPETDTLIITKDFPCYTGSGPQYNTLSTLKAGTQMNVVGYSFAGGWYVAAHPTLQGKNCWIDEDFVESSVPVGELRLIAAPPKPTPTPSLTPEPREKEGQPTACPTHPQLLTCQ